MFEYLKQLLKKAKQRKPDRPPTAEERLAKKLQPYESILLKIQEIVTWEDPSHSFLALCLVNLFFWFLSYVQWRFYGLLFSILCLIVVHEAWVEHVWPEIRYVDPAGGDAASRKSSLDEWVSHSPSHEGLLTVPEISHYATGLRAAVSTQYARLQNLRRNDPQQYCAFVSVGCIVAATVGSVLSGATLIYATFMTAMCAPGIVRHLLSPEWKRFLFDVLTSMSTVLAPPDANIDMYVPDENRENLAYLQQAADNTDMSTPSTGSSSLADLLIPGHDESSLDTQDSFALSTIPQEASSSDDELLQFKPTHFNGKEGGSAFSFFDVGDGSNSSSSSSRRRRRRKDDDESDPLLNDLPEEIERALDATSSTTSGIKDVVTSALYRTFPKAFTSAKPTFSQHQDDSDSDFEIIENEDD